MQDVANLTISLGNLGQLYRMVVGEVDFEWQDKYGGVARINGPLGVSSYHHLPP